MFVAQCLGWVKTRRSIGDLPTVGLPQQTDVPVVGQARGVRAKTGLVRRSDASSSKVSCIVTLPCLIHGKRVRMSAARSLTTPSADIPGEYVSAQAAVLELGIRKAGEIVVSGRSGVVVGAGPHP